MTEISQNIEGGMTRLRIDLAYDGKGFAGWAKQPGLRTVQGELERAIALIIRKEPGQVSATVAGRTDSGVHARAQVCHIDVGDDDLTRLRGRADIDGAIARKLNGVLKRFDARDVVVHSVTRVSQYFDARFSALSRRYEYRVRPVDVRQNPLDRHFTVDLNYSINLDLLQAASDTFLGLKDFTSYCKAREGATAVRTLLDFTWTVHENGVLSAKISADAFCHSMVRSLVGAALAVASGSLTIEELNRITLDRKRTSEIYVMPPEGLSLESVEYPGDREFAERAQQTRSRRSAIQ